MIASCSLADIYNLYKGYAEKCGSLNTIAYSVLFDIICLSARDNRRVVIHYGESEEKESDTTSRIKSLSDISHCFFSSSENECIFSALRSTHGSSERLLCLSSMLRDSNSLCWISATWLIYYIVPVVKHKLTGDLCNASAKTNFLSSKVKASFSLLK